ncbi:unnamed protein product, partial [Musa hybrid cultivar]
KSNFWYSTGEEFLIATLANISTLPQLQQRKMERVDMCIYTTREEEEAKKGEELSGPSGYARKGAWATVTELGGL